MDSSKAKIVEDFLENLGSAGGEETLGRVSLEREMNLVEKKLRSAKGVKQLLLLQRRENLAVQWAEVEKRSALEEVFVGLLAEYAEANGISYTTLREFGVSKQLLERAGVRRTRRKAKVQTQ